MNEQEARAEFQRPLKFGDDRQIRALRFLDSLEEMIAHILDSPECEECSGNGTVYDPPELNWIEHCQHCHGLGHFFSFAALEIPANREDVLQSAIEALRDRNMKAALNR